MTGSSVLALTYKDGVMIASDTLGTHMTEVLPLAHLPRLLSCRACT